MATYDQIQAELPGVLSTLLSTETQTVPCQWRQQPQQMHASSQVTIDWLTERGLGVDELVVEDVDEEGEPTTDPELVDGVRETAHGLREVTLQVTAWTADQRLGRSARALLERLRARLHWTSATVLLAELGLGLVRIEPTLTLDPSQDGRAASVATMDVVLGYGMSESDAPIPFIETARVAGEFVGSSVEVDINPPPEP